MATVLQINLNHCEAVQDILFQQIWEEKSGIVIISEQHRDLREPNWVWGITRKVAIWVCGELRIYRKMTVPISSFNWVEVAYALSTQHYY